MLDRHKEQVEHQELLAGIVASTVANFSFGASKKPLTPDAFMPSRWAKQKPQKKERLNRRVIARNIGSILRGAVMAQEKRSK